MAGKSPHNPKNELHAPIWVPALQLIFAAMLLYAIKNPLMLQEFDASLQLTDKQPSLIIQIPVSNVAVAATLQSRTSEHSM